MTTVLIVDDDPDVRKLVELKLQTSGYETRIAGNGVEGLDALEAHDIDIVVLDLMMPVMDGLEMCSRMRMDDRFRDIPVVMLTARAQPADIERGFELGATDYVVKPFSPRELVSRIRSLVG